MTKKMQPLFLNKVDAAAVYHNASTRFTDGFEFGYGAEIGISTQKLHARGPMGLQALTSSKFVIQGNGQIRNKYKNAKPVSMWFSIFLETLRKFNLHRLIL